MDTRTRRARCAAGTLAATICAVAPAPIAVADTADYALNGTYTVVSNGEWAQQNERYQDEPTVRSTWHVTTTCTTPFTCSGKVTSSLGWTEDVYTTSGSNWFVRHRVPDWIPCPDGSTAAGQQVFRFYPAGDSADPAAKSNLLLGEDRTTGDSGNCGRNTSVVVTLPVKLVKTG